MTDFKRTGTFSYSCLITLPAGVWSADSTLRNARDQKVADLVATLTPTLANQYQLLLEFADPSAWELGELHGDVLFTDASVPPVKIPSGTFTINVVHGDTR